MDSPPVYHRPSALEARADVMEGDVVEGSVRLCRQKVNHRLLYVQVRFTLLRRGAPVEPERTCNYRID